MRGRIQVKNRTPAREQIQDFSSIYRGLPIIRDVLQVLCRITRRYSLPSGEISPNPIRRIEFYDLTWRNSRLLFTHQCHTSLLFYETKIPELRQPCDLAFAELLLHHSHKPATHL